MSADTKAAIETAIAAHISDEYGDFTAHWTVIAGVVSTDGAHGVAIEAPEDMPLYVQRGLIGEALHELDAD